MKILFIGDIFGRPGRTIVKDRLPELRKQHLPDLVIANCENAAAGFGITPPLAEELFDLGIDVMTTGNHVWDKREIIEYFQMADGNPHSPARRLLRPANFSQGLPGWGVYEGQKNGVGYAVVNLQGRVFMGSSDDPFRFADRLLEQIKSNSKSMPKPAPRKLRSDGTSMGASPRSSARTRTFPPRMRRSCRRARPTSPTSA